MGGEDGSQEGFFAGEHVVCMGEEAVDEGEGRHGGDGGGGFAGGSQTLDQGPQPLLRRRGSYPLRRHFGVDL